MACFYSPALFSKDLNLHLKVIFIAFEQFHSTSCICELEESKSDPNMRQGRHPYHLIFILVFGLK